MSCLLRQLFTDPTSFRPFMKAQIDQVLIPQYGSKWTPLHAYYSQLCYESSDPKLIIVWQLFMLNHERSIQDLFKHRSDPILFETFMAFLHRTVLRFQESAYELENIETIVSKFVDLVADTFLFGNVDTMRGIFLSQTPVADIVDLNLSDKL